MELLLILVVIILLFGASARGRALGIIPTATDPVASSSSSWSLCSSCFCSAGVGSKEGAAMSTVFLVIVVVLDLAVIGLVSLFRRRGR